jgi:hypothetical protein
MPGKDTLGPSRSAWRWKIGGRGLLAGVRAREGEPRGDGALCEGQAGRSLIEEAREGDAVMLAIIGIILFVAGVLMAAFAYDYTVRLAFKYGPYKGMLTYVIGPLAVFFVSEMRKDPKMHKVWKMWGISFAVMILGLVVFRQALA